MLLAKSRFAERSRCADAKVCEKLRRLRYRCARIASFFTCRPSRGRKQPVIFERKLTPSEKHESF
jgi:hypothetical protein